MKPAILAWAPIMLVALGMSVAWRLDGPAHSEFAVADDLAIAQAQAAQALRHDLAAAKLCRTTHGEAAFAWTADGGLVCIPRRSKPVVARMEPLP